MLLSNKVLFPVIENNRVNQLMEYDDVALLCKIMQDRFLLTPTETINELYNNF